MAEIIGRLPYQTKSKVAAQLAEDGYLEFIEHKIPTDIGQMTVGGYYLTHLGRITCGMIQSGYEV